MKTKLHKVEERLVKLAAMKNIDNLTSLSKDWDRFDKVQRLQPKNPEKSDYKTNIAFSVKTTKDAELLGGTQEYNFIPVNGDARRNVPLLKKIWAYWWLMSKTDKRLSRVIPSSTSKGTGIMYEGIKTILKKVKVPRKLPNGTLEFTEETRVDYDGIYCEFIPFRNFYIDGTDLEDSNEAVWIKYWDRDTYINEHSLLKSYDVSAIPSSKGYTVVEGTNDPKGGQDNENIITELRYYNKSNDEFIVLANGAEVHSSPIPFIHKELPFCLYYDYQLDDRIWGMGEYELLKEDILYKDSLRSLSIDVIKAQMGVTAVNDDVELDESSFEMGPLSFMRTSDINGMKHYSPTINTNLLENAEQKVDNDIITKTGIDFRIQQLNRETTTKTRAKQESLKKRINLNLKINGYSFFERLARLRLSNIQLIHSAGNTEISIEGGSIKKDGKFEANNGGYGSFTITPETVAGKFNIIPITESLLGITEERDKQTAIQATQILGNLVGSDGKAVFPGEVIGKFLSNKLGVDFEELSGSIESKKDPEQMVKEALNNNKGISNDNTNPDSPDFIPAEQRSGAKQNVPTLSGQASNVNQ